MNKKRINELLNTKRLEFKHKQSNTTDGLYQLIKKYVNSTHTVVELGSFAGVSSELFALHCEKLYCVDPWKPYWEINEINKIIDAEKKFDGMSENYNNIVKKKMSSNDASVHFENYSLDLVYIDSDHSSENVEKEIKLWYSKIKKDGYISGHDYGREDINQAIEETIGTPDHIFVDSSWFKKL